MSRIPAATNDKNSASTLQRETEDYTLSKIISLQYILDMSNEDICCLSLIANGSLAVAVSQSMNKMKLHQKTGRKSFLNVPLQAGNDLHRLIVGLTSRQPFDRNNSPCSCWQPKSRQKNFSTSFNSKKVQSGSHFLALRPSAKSDLLVFLDWICHQWDSWFEPIHFNVCTCAIIHCVIHSSYQLRHEEEIWRQISIQNATWLGSLLACPTPMLLEVSQEIARPV